MNNIFEAETIEIEPTSEKTINEIKANHLKHITSIDINVSAITPNKHYSSSEHLEYDLMPYILLQSLENHHNSPIICLKCTLMETPNSKFENGGFL